MEEANDAMLVADGMPPRFGLGVKRSRSSDAANISPFKRQMMRPELCGEAFPTPGQGMGRGGFWPTPMAVGVAPLQDVPCAEPMGAWPLAAVSVSSPGVRGGGALVVSTRTDVLPGAGSGAVHMLPIGTGGEACSEASVREAGHVGLCLLRLLAREVCAWCGVDPSLAALLQQPGRDLLVRFEAEGAGGKLGGAWEGVGAALVVSMLRSLLGVGLWPGVVVVGDVTLAGRLVCGRGGAVAARVRAALAAGAERVVVPRAAEGEMACTLEEEHRAAVALVDDLPGLLQQCVAGFERTRAPLGGPGTHGQRPLVVAPVVLPFDDVAVCMRTVEAVALPRAGRGAGALVLTGIREEQGQGMVRSALNAARFVLLKRQAAISELLGPPTVDLRSMTRRGRGVDILLHLPQACASMGYGAPMLLALTAVVWNLDPAALRHTASVGEVNALGCLSSHERTRPTFLQALREHGMRRAVLPRGQALEVIREGGGVGDCWTLPGGVVVYGVESAMDLVRAVFMG